MLPVTFAVAGSLLLIAMSGLIREGRPSVEGVLLCACAGTLLSLVVTHEWPWWIGGVVGTAGYHVAYLSVRVTMKVLIRRRRARTVTK